MTFGICNKFILLTTINFYFYILLSIQFFSALPRISLPMLYCCLYSYSNGHEVFILLIEHLREQTTSNRVVFFLVWFYKKSPFISSTKSNQIKSDGIQKHIDKSERFDYKRYTMMIVSICIGLLRAMFTL